mmetsp:Transcript_16617/g.36418  ORF Transcript_16617/g.36418 Transcript_16617/m.36418 type:complete len:81 (-) Transcript_16617:146-388(-)
MNRLSVDHHRGSEAWDQSICPPSAAENPADLPEDFACGLINEATPVTFGLSNEGATEPAEPMRRSSLPALPQSGTGVFWA